VPQVGALVERALVDPGVVPEHLPDGDVGFRRPVVRELGPVVDDRIVVREVAVFD